MSEPKTWQDIIHKVHPEWPAGPVTKNSERTKARIRNKAYANGYEITSNGVVVYPITGVVEK